MSDPSATVNLLTCQNADLINKCQQVKEMHHNNSAVQQSMDSAIGNLERLTLGLSVQQANVQANRTYPVQQTQACEQVWHHLRLLDSLLMQMLNSAKPVENILR